MGAAAPVIPYVVAALAAGAQYKNTQDTARRQDEQAAQGILSQSRIQKKADSRVDQTVQQLEGSTSADAKAARLDDYMNTLRANKASLTRGLTPTIGGAAFQADSSNAAAGTQDFASKTAGLMARMDAPGVQRQQEGFDYGNLATDLGQIGRQSQGQSFLDQLKLNAIRRNAKIDLAAGLANAYAGSAMGSSGAANYNGGAGNVANVGVNSSGRAVAFNPY